MTEMILAGTGHRMTKLGGYTEIAFQKLIAFATVQLSERQPAEVISGMALGWDQALAMAAVACKIPFIAAVPHTGQELMWPAPAQERYRRILVDARQIVIVSPGPYAAWKMQRRNEWMVQECTDLLALWDGSSGGTHNCVKYAEQVGRNTINCYEAWRAFAV